MPYKDNTLFIHTPRSGGMVVNQAMGIEMRNGNKDELFCYRKGLHFYPAKKIHKMGLEYENVFTIIRDPVTRMISVWHYAQKHWEYLAKKDNTNPVSFFIKACKKFKNQDSFYNFFSSYCYMLDDLPTNIKILRQRTLTKDWAELVEEWGLPWEKAIKRTNRGKSRGKIKLPYEAKQEIGDIYKDDYKMFKDYNFDFAS